MRLATLGVVAGLAASAFWLGRLAGTPAAATTTATRNPTTRLEEPTRVAPLPARGGGAVIDRPVFPEWSELVGRTPRAAASIRAAVVGAMIERQRGAQLASCVPPAEVPGHSELRLSIAVVVADGELEIGAAAFEGVLDGDEVAPEVGACVAAQLSPAAPTRVAAPKDAEAYRGRVEYTLAIARPARAS